jgi:hypothetical protein
MESETKNCQNCKQDFIIEPEDFNFYQKIKVPPPTFCWECRHQRRLAFRNERNFYKHNCDLCSKSVVSRISPDKPYKMYCTKCWWSDKWDPEEYAKEYDFSRPFFEQWKELFFQTPHISLYNVNNVDSEWVNQESDDKNCYMNIGGLYNEDSAHSTYEVQSKNCFDSYFVMNSDYCSHCINCERDYSTHYSMECHDCLDTYYSYDCRNCNNIIGCAGLRNKSYCIFNEQYTKESYQEYLKEHPLSSYKMQIWWQNEKKKIWEKSPHRESMLFKTVNCTGNDLDESKNTHNAWQGTKLEDCKNVFITGWMRDAYDVSCAGANEVVYELAHSGGAYNSKFLLFCLSSDPLKKMTIDNVEYSATTTSASNCFGCVNIRGGEYMILNRRYTKEEYNEILPKIKQHMNDMPYVDSKGKVYKYGEFFPAEFSPFGYNETTGQEFKRLTKDESADQGYIWSDHVSDAKYEFSDYEIPDDIKDVGDDVLEKILKCSITGKAYKIIQMELSFYRKVGLPIPRIHPNERHDERIRTLLPIALFDRQCDFCQTGIKTPYAPGRPEVVYCEQCYQKEVL